MSDWIFDHIFDNGWALAGIGVLLLGGAITIAYFDEVQWQAFAVAHECRKIGEISGSMSVGTAVTTTPNGVGVGPVTMYTPGKTGYACNDGQTYWR